ncbi:MAG: BrnA antitoxin family protein [Pseudomonadota bacterium]
MTESKRVSPRSLKSDLKRVAAHVIQPEEYEELPELTDEMLARGTVNKGGRPRSPNPKRLISIRLTDDVIERWRSTGPGWQTRMAEKLTRSAPK